MPAFACRHVVSLAVIAASSSLTLAVPYKIELEARASVGAGATYFNVPSGSSFSSATPDINDSREVVFKTTTSGTGTAANNGIFYGSGGVGGLVYVATDGGSLSDPFVNNSNKITFPSTGATVNGIFQNLGVAGSTTLFSNGPLGASSWSSPKINASGQVGTRVNFSGSGQAYAAYSPVGVASVRATEVGVDSTSPYSFLYSSNFDDNGNLYGKVTVGAAGQTAVTFPDQIRRFAPNGTTTLIAEDRDGGNAASPFTRFDNSIGVSDDGKWVTFVAYTGSASSTRTVFAINTLTSAVTTVAVPGTGLTSIDSFTPAVNNSGVVTFRATDLNAKISVFVGGSIPLQRIIGVGDSIVTDANYTTATSAVISSLGGNPMINNSGDVAFGGGLTGAGNFIATALVPEPASLTTLAGFALLCRRRR